MYTTTPVRYILLAVAAAAAMMLSSCGSHRTSVKAAHGYNKRPGAGKSPGTITVSDALPEHTKALLSEASQWLGVPYRYGGYSRSEGVDCSGLVCNLFENTLSIKLPRSSRQQGEYCARIDKSELIAGDLVFFSTGSKGKISHVGMYVGGGNIVHSSSSRGVIVSSLNESYYLRTYHSSGRVAPYYAMVEKDIKGRKGKKRKEAPAKEKTAPLPTGPGDNPATDVEPPLQASLDYRRVKEAAKGAIMKVADKSTQKVTERIVAVTGGNAAREALERTRRKVLDEVIEQKVDSIVSDFFD